MSNRIRSVPITFWVTPEEKAAIHAKMAEIGAINMSAYIRKIAIDGYIIHVAVPELREVITLLRRNGNNINQLAKVANTTGSIYAEDLEAMKRENEKLWPILRQIILKLAQIS